MLNGSDYIALAGIAVSPTVAVGLYVASAFAKSAAKREIQHAANQTAIADLKNGIGDLKDNFGNRLTAVEVALEHVAGWHGHEDRRSR